MKKIAILGSTGSIGTQTLDIVNKNEDLQVVGLAAGSNISMLEEQIRRFHPKLAAVGNEEKAKELREKVKDTDCKIAEAWTACWNWRLWRNRRFWLQLL